jgi:3-deoxy-D-manno-oct-2-ulosonic acid (Kdo) hydroxylase
MLERLQFSGLEEAKLDLPRILSTLEHGGLIEFPAMGFEIAPGERDLIDMGVVSPKSKNVSLGPGGAVRGTTLDDTGQARMGQMLARFVAYAENIVQTLLPSYADALSTRRTSFRPGAVETRVLSPRRDDRRLHVDAFPSNPTQGRRILRVFCNVNPVGSPRVWNVGELDFENFAKLYVDRLSGGPSPLAAWAMAATGLTRGQRSRYDQAMLELHDFAKLDEAFQAQTPRSRIEFPAGAAWIVFSDSVLHAALSGQHLLEQTFLLPIDAMAEPEMSPLETLRRLTGRALA